MAELVEGTYAIVSVQSSKVVEVTNGADAANANIQIWTWHSGDAMIFHMTKPEGTNWRITNGMTLRVIGASSPNSQGVRNVVQQDNTNNTTTQRWIITDRGLTHTFRGVTYPVYRINWAGDSSLGFDVEYFGTQDGSNIALHGVGASATVNQQWIFVPLPSLSDGGFYKISPKYVNKVLGIASGSTANGAVCQLESNDDTKDSQIFFARQDASSGAFYLLPAHSMKAGSEMALDAWGGASELKNLPYVNQGTHTAGKDNQLWFMLQVPGSEGTVTRDGTPYSVYEIRAVVGNNYDLSIYRNGKTSDLRVYLHPRQGGSGNDAQRFIFIKTEGAVPSLGAPGAIDKRFSRKGPGSITVSGLSFNGGSNTKFQARYRYVDYKNTTRTSPTYSSWRNVVTDSTARSGWGLAGEANFEKSAGSDAVSVPFNKTRTLVNSGNSLLISFDIEFEVRAFTDNYLNQGYAAHGPVAAGKVVVTQEPETTVSSVTVDATASGIGIHSVLANEPNIGVSSVRARLLDASGNALSDYITSSTLDITHPFDGMYSIPENGDTVYIEYTMVMIDGNVINGQSSKVISYTSLTFDATIAYTDDDSCRAIVTANQHSYDYCFVKNQGVSGTQLIKCNLQSTQNGKNSFVVLPSLNRDCEVYLVGSQNGTQWGMTKLTCHVDSHLFIWNWSYKGSGSPEDEFASILINTDKPPQQKRSFTTDIKFSVPAGRVHPVGFSMSTLSSDLSINGVVVDDDADYVAAGPIPNHSSIANVRSLIPLSGLGIHPAYRTPYGDFYTVGIESVDISKNELGLSLADVKQRAVKD